MALSVLGILIIVVFILLILGGVAAYALYVNFARDEDNDGMGSHIGIFIGCGIIALALLVLIGFAAFFFFGFVPVGP